MSVIRSRSDRCPGVFRPWPADDGLLVRLRLIGGRVPAAALRGLVEAAEEFGDGRVHVTSRANLQVRAFPGADGVLAADALAALEATGLVPGRSHELVRNVMVSPQTGVAGGLVDLRVTAGELDSLLCADPLAATLPGRFLFVLDDGRGDLIGQTCDLGLVALPGGQAQLRVGRGWAPVVRGEEAAARLVALARRFAELRGGGPAAPWHVDELSGPLLAPAAPDPRLPVPAPVPAFGPVAGGRHVEVTPDGMDRGEVAELTAGVSEVVVTPWRGVFVPEEER
ncbi:hypothetical protein SRB5_11670 [Streptomyces sp. RB5]|uniref:Nitrite/Sulfite reductase ferredoxin-like domain-containing protein n=1 Tax=Streptomyces smaragdinus TaxID=2585196 RepID=A0A7K0CCC2_9ACTN|nr:nitrite reductase [Streptomyces smaragdinus]MQY11053.1 hypothetical protein [Streptomyces smaragdinus]